MARMCLFILVGLAVMAGAETEFKPRKVVKPFEVIKDAPVLDGREAEEFVSDDELGVGVVAGGKARAYPLNQLTNPSREIINDHLGGIDLAATW